MRSSPTPCAPWRTAISISSGRSTLPISRIGRPSGRDAGCSTMPSSSSSSLWRRLTWVWASSSSPRVGSSTMVPAWPSSSTIVPAAIWASAPGAPITAGMPSECARIAACEVRVPSSLTSPTTWSRSSCTVRPGESSWATTIDLLVHRHATTARRRRGPSAARSIRSWMACRSASRSRSRALPDHRFRSSSALNS